MGLYGTVPPPTIKFKNYAALGLDALRNNAKKNVLFFINKAISTKVK